MARTENRIEKKKDFCLASSIVMLLISHYFSSAAAARLRSVRFCTLLLLLFRCKFNVPLSLPVHQFSNYTISREMYIMLKVNRVCRERERAEASSIVGILSMLGVHSNLSLPKPQPMRISEMVSDSLRSRKKGVQWEMFRRDKNYRKTIFFRDSFFIFLLLSLPSSPISASRASLVSLSARRFRFFKSHFTTGIGLRRLPLC